VGLVARLTREGDTARLRVSSQDDALAPLLIPQGSVAVNGVSLTVASLDGSAFEIMLIPHTLDQTTLGGLEAGERVNLEMDMIGKYVQRALAVRGERV
jgi:riboflavin synthase alpha subunit